MSRAVCRKSVASLLTGQRVLSVVNLGDKTPMVILEKGEVRLFPPIYGGAVKGVVEDPQAGDEVIVNVHVTHRSLKRVEESSIPILSI